MTIKFKIVTPERLVYQDEVDQVSLPTQDGEITVLPNHIPLVSILKPGQLIVKKGQTETAMAGSGVGTSCRRKWLKRLKIAIKSQFLFTSSIVPRTIFSYLSHYLAFYLTE